MMTDKRELYRATETLFRAFHYLQPRMRGGALAPPKPMNAEALAGCILHGCMSRLVRELQEQAAPGRTARMIELDSPSSAG
ncbi:MAG: hypothetical protein ACHP8B_07130 [Terriglobales bacterium]